jgi:hypothetical protein
MRFSASGHTKKHPNTEMNRLEETAKILSQQTDFHVLHETLPCLVQHSCFI